MADAGIVVLPEWNYAMLVAALVGIVLTLA